MRNPSFGADVPAKLHGMRLTRALRPTQNRESRPMARTASLENQSNSTTGYSAAEAAAQRAVAFARRRALHLDHLADRLLHFGMPDAAERLSRTAWEIRAQVLL